MTVPVENLEHLLVGVSAIINHYGAEAVANALPGPPDPRRSEMWVKVRDTLKWLGELEPLLTPP